MSEINYLNIIQVIVAVALILFILIQRGPGATAGSAFGGGASGTVFGAKGTGSFLTKTTAVLATLFFIITMLIAVDASETFDSSGSAETDLGVIGTLEEGDAKPAMIPEDGSDGTGQIPGDTSGVEAALQEAATATENAVDEAAETATEIKDAAVDAAENAINEDDNDAATESDDSDDGDN